MKKITAIFTLLAALALTGCGTVTPSASIEPPTEATTLQSVTEPASSPDKMKLIGDKTSGSSVFIITVENKTGRDINGFSIKTGSEDRFPKNMLQDGDPFLKNEKRMLYYVPVNNEGYAIGDSDAIASEEFLVKVDFPDGGSSVLHQFPFGDVDECELFIDKEVAYIEYTSKSADQKVSTKEAEQMIKANEPDEEPEQETKADNSSYEPVYTQPVYDEPVYTQPATTAYIAPTTQYVETTTAYIPPATQAPVVTEAPTEAPSTPDGGCIGDKGLFY